MGEDVHVIALNGHVLDLHAESFGVVAIDAVERCKCGRMAKPARQCCEVGLEHQVNGIARREWTRAAAVAGPPQGPAITQAAELENEIFAAHVTGTSPTEVGECKKVPCAASCLNEIQVSGRSRAGLCQVNRFSTRGAQICHVVRFATVHRHRQAVGACFKTRVITSSSVSARQLTRRR